MSHSHRMVRRHLTQTSEDKKKKPSAPETKSTLLAREKFTISKDDFEIFEDGTDTYVSPGAKKSGVRYKHREKFLNEHPLVATLLEREDLNPLLREGKEEERKGEHYLTYEILALLIHLRIIVPDNIRKPTIIFMHDNDPHRLELFLNAFDLKDGEDALIISVDKVHVVFQYLYRDKETVKVIYFDSEPGSTHIADHLGELLKHKFKQTFTYNLDGIRLQKDFFSCATLVAKFAKLCVKQGKKVFESFKLDKSDHSSVYQGIILQLKHLPAAWRKMSQTEIFAAEKEDAKVIAQEIASQKSGKTLENYLSETSLQKNQKKLNIAAAIKKYKYLDLLERWLETILNDAEKSQLLNAKVGYIALPKALQKIINHFMRIPKQQKPADPIALFLSQAQQLETALEEKLDPVFSFLESDAANHIKKVKPYYSKEKFKLFSFLVLAIRAENNNHFYHYQFTESYADKLLTLFKTADEAISFLAKAADFSSQQPIHDACLFELPKVDWNVDEWRKLANIHGSKITPYLALAPRIEEAMQKEGVSFENITLEKIKQLRNSITYKRFATFPDMAEMCIKHNVSEDNFDKCVDILQTQLKTFDILPDIVINGGDINPRYKKLTFKKLDYKDWRGLLLGDFTGCCQSVGKEGDSCAVHGTTSPYSSFYVIVDEKDRIIAQSWTWIGKDGTIVFDSIESKGKDRDAEVTAIFVAAADKLLEQGATAVQVGDGGNTPIRLKKSLPSTKPTELVDAKGDTTYSDASEQLLIKRRDRTDFLTSLAKHIGQPDVVESKSAVDTLMSHITEFKSENIFQLSKTRRNYF